MTGLDETKVGLFRDTLTAKVCMSPQMVGEATVEVLTDYVSEQLVCVVRTHIWGENAGRLMVRVPADWWQAVKERWLPWRLRRRFPVRYRVVTADARVVYPAFRPRLPDLEHVMVAVRTGQYEATEGETDQGAKGGGP